jgi:hypothetical protein
MRQDKSVIEYKKIQDLTRKRFKKAEHLKKTLLELEERGFIHQKQDGRKWLLEVNPYLLEAQKSAHIAHNNPKSPSEREKQRGEVEYTLVHNTHDLCRDKSNVGNVYQRVSGVPTLQNQEPQEITQNVGNVGKNQGLENEDDADLII